MRTKQETWTAEQYDHWAKTGEFPEDSNGIPPCDAFSPSIQKPNKADLKAEKELQALCENYLVQNNYLRLTADNATAVRSDMPLGFKGWFGHMHKPKQNPLMPDLFIFDMNGRCLNVELKVVNIWQPGQKEMVEMGFWQVAWSFQQFEELLHDWEIHQEY